MNKYVVSYSGGLGSFYATKMLIDKYGKNNVVCLFVDVNYECADLYRFIKESTAHLGVDLFTLQAPFNPIELSEKQNVIYNSRMTNCSLILKTRLLSAFLTNKKYIILKKEYPINVLVTHPNKPTYLIRNMDNSLFIGRKMALGIDFSEIHRCETPTNQWAKKGYECVFPLIEEYLTYSPIMARDYLEEHNIKIPSMYTDGFSHNNCSGRCFRAGQGHFALLLKKRPKEFNEFKMFENHMREKTGLDISILKKSKNGQKIRYTLEQLEEDVSQRPHQIDMYEFGGCGCFVEDK